MISRDLIPELERCKTEYPIITITGPRQSGKTTLSRAAFPDLDYLNFESPDTRAAFQADPRGFLSAHAGGAIFDEAQRVPELFSWLQGVVDEDPRPGRFVLTGSQHFGLMEKITQSLAGRAAILELLPFSLRELERGGYAGDNLDSVLRAGAYPRVHDRGIRPERWYSDYLATYLERDLRQLSAIGDLDRFQRFMTLAAGRVGQLVNLNNLAGDVGVDHKTIDRWLTLLQASYIAIRLRPYHRNLRKRLVKSPKLFFYDTGLVCYLLGIHEESHLSAHPLRGSIFENWVVAEVLKMQANRASRDSLSFFRTHDGQKVDLIRERGGSTDLIECKAGETVMPKMLGPLKRVSGHWEGEAPRRWLIHGGSESTNLLDTRLLSWRHIVELDRESTRVD